jgi:hypothetical protein
MQLFFVELHGMILGYEAGVHSWLHALRGRWGSMPNDFLEISFNQTVYIP